MTNLIEYISSSYKYLFEDLSYPLNRNWPLVGSPLPAICIVLVYAYFCIVLGPQYMKNKKPYTLTKPLCVYNMIQVLVNIYMCYEAIKYLFFGQYNFMCENIDSPTTARARKAVTVGYVFYMVKYLDLIDTVFFVLRKSNRQITILHLHHHMIMPLGAWLGITYFPGGPAAVIVFFNSFVHSIMYTYYLIAGLGEQYKKYLWWKKYVTTLQLIQFATYMLHNVNSLFYDCGYPPILKVLILIYSFVFLYMFGKFYYQTFIVADKKKDINKKVANGIKKNN